MPRPFRQASLWIALALLIVACKSPSEPDESSPISPLPTVALRAESPLPTPPPSPELTRFHLDEPLQAGATHVTGRGPAGLVIQIVDVTYAGEQLGSGEISGDGTFDIETAPLPQAHMIGILSSEPLPPELEANVDALRGEGAIDLPKLGRVYTAAMSTPE